MILAALLVLGGGVTGEADSDIGDLAFRPHPGAELPLALSLIDEQGRTVSLGRYFAGRPVVLVLEYLRCKTLCGVTLESLVGALDALPVDAGRDFHVVAISIDPRDGPSEAITAKTKYLTAYHHPAAAAGWHFLTGSRPVVQMIADSVGFRYRYDADLDQYLHPAGFILAAPDGTISQYLLGLAVDPPQLQTALADAARGRTVGLLTRLWLLCGAQDPQRGRYSLMIEAAFAAANLAAIAGAIAAFIAIWRRRRA